jgi:ribosomal RNA-processing protein 8
VVADMGCGDAKLAQTLAPTGTTVHSFDLVSVNPRVVACDIAHTPLQASCCDVVVFCLSLMGTNIATSCGRRIACSSQAALCA